MDDDKTQTGQSIENDHDYESKNDDLDLIDSGAKKEQNRLRQQKRRSIKRNEMYETSLNKMKVKRVDLKDKELKWCFQVLIDRKKLILDQYKLNTILASLYINPVILKDTVICNVLMEMLVYYMKVWPGWSRSPDYFSGTLPYKEWYDSFQNYLIYKMYHIISEEKKYRAEASKKNSAKTCEKGTNTDKLNNSIKPTAPYALKVMGMPNQLSNLIFSECDNNIVMKQHDGRPWQHLSMKQLLNWPNVSVELRFQDITIRRKNMHEFSRYLSLCGDISPCPESDFISYIKPSQDNVTHHYVSYSSSLIEAYTKQFVSTFRNIPGINMGRISEIQTIFEEFINDINEANVHDNTVCTHTSVCYNIGKMKYIRNKKLVLNTTSKGNESKGINFYETVIPRVEYTLENFKDTQDLSTPDLVTFSLLNTLKNNFDSLEPCEQEKIKQFVNNNCITYSCNFCDAVFCQGNVRNRLLSHLQLEHTSEQPVLCFRCKQQFYIVNLTMDRWSHACTTNCTATSG